MNSGTLTWLNPDRRFGFIAPDTGGDDLYMHIASMESGDAASLLQNSRVSFEIGGSPRAPQAIRVKLLAAH